MVWQRKEKSTIPIPHSSFPGQGECDRHSVPTAALEGHSPHTGEGTGVKTRRKKLLGVRSTRDPKQMVTLSLQTQKRAFGAHFYPLPTLLRGVGGGEIDLSGEERVSSLPEVARKECPASKKLSPLPRSATEEVVVAPTPPSPVPGAR